MKKLIFNTSIRSFFRELGRILAYAFVGFIMFFILDKFGFATIVHADTYKSIDVYQFAKGRWCFSSSYTPNSDNCSIANHDNNFIYKSYNSTDFSALFYFSSDPSLYKLDNSTTSVIIPILLQNTEDLEFVDKENNEYNIIDKSYFNYQVSAKSSLGGWATCTLLSYHNDVYYYSCPANEYFITLRLTSNFIQADTSLLRPVPTVTFGVSELWTQTLNDNVNIQNALNQTQQNTDDTKQNTEDIKNSITNSNTDDANSSSDAFFDDFDSGDTGSLMNLVKLPIKFLDKLNSVCTPVQIDTGYLGTFSIQCLSSYLYNVSGFSQIFNIVSLLINGFIMYGCIKSIITCVQRLKNPDDDEIEVIDL